MCKSSMLKTIKLSEETWEVLSREKLRLKLQRISQVVDILIKHIMEETKDEDTRNTED